MINVVQWALVAAVALAAALGSASAQARRAAADLSCVPAQEALAYDCLVRLKVASTGEPLSGLSVTVGADMPSMAMAHNVRPVPAQEAGEPGTYKARLALEMLGDWAVRIDVDGPLRDRVVLVMRFEDRSVFMPPSRAPSDGGHRRH